MSPEKWRGFAIAVVVFVFVAGALLYDQGGLTSMGPVGVAILLLAGAIVGLLLFLYLKKAPDDSG